MYQRWTAVTSEFTRSQGHPAPPVDPYATWAQRTDWRGFVRMAGAAWHPGGEATAPQGDIHIIARAPADSFFDELPEGMEVDSLYRSPSGLMKHFTARIRRAKFDPLALSKLGLLWELAMPRRDAGSNARGRPGRYGSVRENEQYRPPAVFGKNAFKGDPPKAQAIDGNVMAVIDFGCPFLHTAFTSRDGKCRVRALWDQGSEPVPGRLESEPWRKPEGFGFGRELPQAWLDQIHAELRSGQRGLDEEQAYRGISHLIDYDDARWRMWRSTHGAHVLGLAGGSPDPLDPEADQADAASQASLIFVELPALTAADSAGGSLSSCLLDAVRFVLARCTATAKIVINISYGSFAGPHDGSSLIEQALDELLLQRPNNFAIVLGAGNSRRSGCHVRRKVRPQRSARLRCDISAGDPTDTFVEVWYEPLADANLHVRVIDPLGNSSAWVDVKQQSLWLNDLVSGLPVAGVMFKPAFKPSEKALILLALAPTSQPEGDDGPLARAGVWELEVGYPEEVKANVAAECVLDAWIERDDPAPDGEGSQSRFVDIDEADQDGTLSSLATGRLTVVVGGFRMSSGRAAAYSARGQRNSKVPPVYAACEDDDENPDVASLGVRSSEPARMNGTSVAAPVMARRILNYLANHRVSRDQWPTDLKRIIAAKQNARVLRLEVGPPPD
jgi:Subtilase family